MSHVDMLGMMAPEDALKRIVVNSTLYATRSDRLHMQYSTPLCLQLPLRMRGADRQTSC